MKRIVPLVGVALAIAGCSGGRSGDPAALTRERPQPASVHRPTEAQGEQASSVHTGRQASGSGAAIVRGVAQAAARRPAARTYTLVATRRCLERRRGVTVSPLKPSDAHLRAFRDLTQRKSVLVRIGKSSVALAVAKQQADALLLVELVRVPSNPYRVEQRVNAVLLFRPASRTALTTVRACLRG